MSAFYDSRALAERWSVSIDTALQYTRRPGFPPTLVLSSHELRWSVDEVHAWERTQRVARRPRRRPRGAGPVVPSSLPAPTVVRRST